MSPALVLSILLAILLIFLLAWAVRPQKKLPLTPDDVFESLSGERHYARLPPILQSLREDDTDFLWARGHGDLLSCLRDERKHIVLRYLDYLEEEYQVLLEASRILATLAPELSAMGEYERLKRNLRFVLLCRYLRWRLRLGLQPWNVFGSISNITGEMTLRLEMTTARLGQCALAVDYPLFLDQGRSAAK